MLPGRFPRRATTLGLSALVVLATLLASPTRGETRAHAFPAAFRPGMLNTLATSRTAPVAFVGSRDTDSVFAFDPRTGQFVGSVQVGDGPLAVTILEDGTRRLLGVTCDGFYGNTPNSIALVDASDPAAMRLLRSFELPEGLIFLLGYRTLVFVDGGSRLLVTATDPENGRAVLLAFDAETGAELGRADVGFVPGSIAMRETGGRRVVALTQSVAPRGRVTIVDATDLADMRVERVVRFPKKSGLFNVNNVALDADAAVGYVATGQGNALYAFDVATGRVLSKTVVGSFPTTVLLVSLDGAPRLLVTNEGSATLGIYDVANPQLLSLAAIFRAPSAFLDVEPSVSSDGRTAFVGSTDQNKLFAVDVATGAARYRVPTGDRPVTSAVWEGSGELYGCVTASASANVTTVRDDTSGGVLRTFAGEPGSVFFTLYQNVELSRDGRYAFVASKLTNELFAFDAATGALLDRIAVSQRPSQIAVAEDTTGHRRVAVLGSGDSVLTVVDATDPSALAVSGAVSIESPYPFYLEFANVVVTADGTTAFVADGNQFVYSVDLASASIVGSTGTGFVPVTLALREEDGARRLAVLNAMGGSSSVTVLDVTNPVAMGRVSAAPLPADLVVALNNVPTFSDDGRYVLVGASLSERFFSIDAQTGRIAGSVSKTSAVSAAPFADGATQRYATVELGTDEGGVDRLTTAGRPRRDFDFGTSGGGFFLVGNDPVVSADGGSVLVANYGRGSLLAYDRSTGALAGELPLGAGPGQFAVGTGTVVALEVNGTASSVLFSNVSDLTAPTASKASGGAVRDARRAGLVDPASVRLGEGPRAATFSTIRGRLERWAHPSKRK